MILCSWRSKTSIQLSLSVSLLCLSVWLWLLLCVAVYRSSRCKLSFRFFIDFCLVYMQLNGLFLFLLLCSCVCICVVVVVFYCWWFYWISFSTPNVKNRSIGTIDCRSIGFCFYVRQAETRSDSLSYSGSGCRSDFMDVWFDLVFVVVVGLVVLYVWGEKTNKKRYNIYICLVEWFLGGVLFF